MKTKLFFLFLLILPSFIQFSHAQKNYFSLGIIGIASNNYLLIGDSYTNLHLKPTFIINPGFQFSFKHNLSELIAIHSGISYQYQQYSIDSYDTYYRFGELAVPLYFSIKLLKQNFIKLNCQSGFYLNQLIHMEWYEKTGHGWFDGSKNVIGDFKPEKFGIDFYSAIELNYCMKKNREIFISPFWMYHLIEKNYYKGITLSTFGIKIGLTVPFLYCPKT